MGAEAQIITAAGGLLPAIVCGYVEHGVFSVDSGGQTGTHAGSIEARPRVGAQGCGIIGGKPGANGKRHLDL